MFKQREWSITGDVMKNEDSRMFLSSDILWGAVAHDTLRTVNVRKDPFLVKLKMPSHGPRSRFVSHNLSQLYK